MARQYDVAPRGEAARRTEERSAEEIRHDIAAKRKDILETVDKLEVQFQKRLDWREYFARHPYTALGVAAGLGFLVTGMLKRR